MSGGAVFLEFTSESMTLDQFVENWRKVDSAYNEGKMVYMVQDVTTPNLAGPCQVFKASDSLYILSRHYYDGSGSKYAYRNITKPYIPAYMSENDEE